MKDGHVMNKKIIISLSVGLCALAIIGVSVLGAIDMVKNDMTWAKDVPFKEGLYLSDNIKNNDGEKAYSSFKLEMKLISADEYAVSESINTVAYYREHNDRFFTEYYSMKFSVQGTGSEGYMQLDIDNLDYPHNYYRPALREAYFEGKVVGLDFRINVNKQGIYGLEFGDYTSDLIYKTEN